jgi:hypothetical protein
MRTAFLFLLSIPLFGACNTTSLVTTPDQASVTTCWNQAVTNGGGTVTISAGTATWSSAWTGNATTVSITIQGATTSTFSGTAGQSGYSATWGDNSATCSSVGTCITISVDDALFPAASNNALVRVTGITFISTDSGTSHGIFACNGTHTQINCRLDHCHFEMYPGSVTTYFYNGYGLVDHNQFDDIGAGGGQPFAFGGDFASVGYLNWQDATNFGSNQAWIVEQNIANSTGTGDGFMDAYYGAKVTVRYNNFNVSGAGNTSSLGFGHGTDSGFDRSVVLQEVYNNYLSNTTGNNVSIGNVRGGSFLFFNNTMAGTSPWTAIDLQYFRCLGQNHSSNWGLVCNTWGSTPNPVLNLAWVPTSATITSGGASEVTLNASDWQASHSYTCSTGSPCQICPTSNNAGGFNYIATASGTSSGTRPTFNQTFPPTTGTTDNSITWYNVGGVCTASPNPGVSYGFLPAAPDTTGTTSAYTYAMDGLGGTKGTYPFRDQPGRSQNQTLTPIYAWGNTGSEAPATILGTDAATANIIASGTDFYNSTTMPGYTPYTYPDPLEGPFLSISPSSLSFGNQNVGTTSAEQTFTVTNSGSVSATISSATWTTGTQFAYQQSGMPSGTALGSFMSLSSGVVLQ